MTTYNAVPYIRDTVFSVLNQTFKDFEFIIVDDGSMDETVRFIKDFDDDRLVLIQQNHQNYVDLLNMAIDFAKGHYLVKMDHDDVMMPTKLEKQYVFMESNLDIDVSGTWAEAFGKNVYVIKTPCSDSEIRAMLLLQCPIIHPSVIFRKSSVDKYCQDHGFLYNSNYMFADDYKLWVDLSLSGWKFANIPEPLLKYRLSDEQITSVFRSKSKDLSIQLQKEYMIAVLDVLLSENSPFQKIVNELILLKGKMSFADVQQMVYVMYKSFLTLKHV